MTGSSFLVLIVDICMLSFFIQGSSRVCSSTHQIRVTCGMGMFCLGWPSHKGLSPAFNKKTRMNCLKLKQRSRSTYCHCVVFDCFASKKHWLLVLDHHLPKDLKISQTPTLLMLLPMVTTAYYTIIKSVVVQLHSKTQMQTEISISFSQINIGYYPHSSPN